MTLTTADADGRPWASPVFYVAADFKRFYWVSAPDARHSRNIAARADVSLVIFDSTVPIGGAQAVYVSARAEMLEGQDLERGIDVYSAGSIARGGAPWRLEDVRAPATHRLYVATATVHSVLDAVGDPRPGDRRVEVVI